MANVIRIKRRLNDGVNLSGAPTSLYNSELAFNEVDKTLYYGEGSNPDETAIRVIPIAGSGYMTSFTKNLTAESINNARLNNCTIDVGLY